jgi:hypothetical protein
MWMKPFAVWLAIFFGLFAGLSVSYHLYLTHNPRKVLVVLDTSFPMKTVWGQIPGMLDSFQDRRYTVFGMVTDKARIHGWQPRLNLGNITPYAPRELTKLIDRQTYPEIDAADQVYLVTNASNISALSAAKRWHIMQFHPLTP